MRNSRLGDSSDGMPRPVILGVAFLGLLFLGGAIYLFITSPFTGTEVIAPARLPAVTAALVSYRGTILGMEKKRRIVEQALARLGLGGGTPITLFPESPFFMRPIDVTCRLGYLLPISRQVEGLPEPIALEQVDPGNCLVVRVRGHSNFTGNKAYKAALKVLRPLNLKPSTGEHYELKVNVEGKDFVEHWIPIQ
jgi:hypothetical protein